MCDAFSGRLNPYFCAVSADKIVNPTRHLQSTLNIRMLNIYQYISQLDFIIKHCSNTILQIKAVDELSRAISLLDIDNELKQNNIIYDIFNLEFLSSAVDVTTTQNEYIVNSISQCTTTDQDKFNSIEPDIIFQFNDKTFTSIIQS